MIKTLKRYYNLIGSHKASVFIAVTFCIISGGLAILPATFTGNITDAIKAGSLEYDSLMRSIFWLVFMLVSTYFLDAYYNYVIFRNYYYVDASVRVQLLKKSIRQNPPFFIKYNASNIITKATSDADAIATVASYGIMTTTEGVLLPIIYFITMATISPWLFLIALTALPIMIYVVVQISKKLDGKYDQSLETQDAMNEHALESFTAIKVIKAFDTKSKRLNEFLEKVLINNNKELEVNNIENLYVPVVNGIMSFFAILSIIVGGFLISKGKITLGELITHSMLLQELDWPAYAVADLITVSKSGSISLRRVDKVLNYKERERTSDPVLIKNIDKIEMKNYSFKYPNAESYALKNINLSIKAGQKIGLVGKTGSGKSTLLHQIVAEYDDFEGSLFINGNNIMDINLDSYRKNIGYVPQEHFLFSKSVKDNILFYRDGDYDRAIDIAAFRNDLSSFADGINTQCGEMGITLSGGQKQRVSLARAVLLDPQLLILDDVLSAVDNNTEKEISENLANNFPNTTIIISSHRLSVVKDADEIIVLDNGQISERGKFEDLISSGGWFSDQYHLQEVDHE